LTVKRVPRERLSDIDAYGRRKPLPDYLEAYELTIPRDLVRPVDAGKTDRRENRFVVHVHYAGPSDNEKPVACHFKTWSQRSDGLESADGAMVYRNRITAPSYQAELIGELRRLDAQRQHT
jgi:hypothetical protein